MGGRFNCGQIYNFSSLIRAWLHKLWTNNLSLFLVRNNLAVNDIVQNAVTWKCLKGFVTYFIINNNKTAIHEKRHSVVNSSRCRHRTVLLKVVRCTPEMDKLHYCSSHSRWDGINTVRPTFSLLCLTFTATF